MLSRKEEESIDLMMSEVPGARRIHKEISDHIIKNSAAYKARQKAEENLKKGSNAILSSILKMIDENAEKGKLTATYTIKRTDEVFADSVISELEKERFKVEVSNSDCYSQSSKILKISW